MSRTNASSFEKSEFRVDRVRKEHLSEITTLLSEAILETCRRNNILDHTIYQTEVAGKISRIEKYLESENANDHMSCALYKSLVVGVGGYFYCGPDIRASCNDIDVGDVEIGSVYVRPGYQGLGCGRLLLEALVSRLREKGKRRVFIDSGYGTSQKYWSGVVGPPRVDVESKFGPEYRYMVWEVAIRESGNS